MSEKSNTPAEEKVEKTAEAEDSTKKSKPKKSKSAAEIEALNAELEKQKELLLRTVAEFDNFKKRTEREKLHTAEFAKANVNKTLLPVIDNAERAFNADPSNPDFVKGIEMIVKQLLGIVDGLGLLELANVGDTFDPEIHEAVMHIEDSEKGENEITQVLQQGYKLGDTVIRPAMVQVAN
jgi:molecular chaperone GrpE